MISSALRFLTLCALIEISFGVLSSVTQQQQQHRTTTSKNSNRRGEITLFVAVRSGPGVKNVRYRATARKTWLGIQSMSELPRHSVAYRFFVDGPCDTCAQEEETNGDMVVRQRNSSPDASSNPDATWLHPTFLSDYADPSINYKTQWAPEVCRPFFFFCRCCYEGSVGVTVTHV